MNMGIIWWGENNLMVKRYCDKRTPKCSQTDTWQNCIVIALIAPYKKHVYADIQKPALSTTGALLATSARNRTKGSNICISRSRWAAGPHNNAVLTFAKV